MVQSSVPFVPGTYILVNLSHYQFISLSIEEPMWIYDHNLGASFFSFLMFDMEHLISSLCGRVDPIYYLAHGFCF